MGKTLRRVSEYLIIAYTFTNQGKQFYGCFMLSIQKFDKSKFLPMFFQLMVKNKSIWLFGMISLTVQREIRETS